MSALLAAQLDSAGERPVEARKVAGVRGGHAKRATLASQQHRTAGGCDTGPPRVPVRFGQSQEHSR